jgi:hypothetical protein
VLHLCVQRRRLHLQESCGLTLIAVASVESAPDQFDFVAFNCVVEVDFILVDFDVAVRIMIGRELSPERFNFVSQGPLPASAVARGDARVRNYDRQLRVAGTSEFSPYFSLHTSI